MSEPATPSLWFEPTAADRAHHAQWVAGRPDSIRSEAERLEPWRVWRMRSTGQLVALAAISEPEPPAYPKPTCRVVVWDQILRAPTHQVFGIDCDDLEPGEVRP